MSTEEDVQKTPSGDSTSKTDEDSGVMSGESGATNTTTPTGTSTDNTDNDTGTATGTNDHNNEDRPPIAEVIDRSTDDTAEAKSLELKKTGNDLLVAGKFTDAIKHYSEALEYTPTNAILLSNRAQAYIKLENYGLAIVDADAAIKHDPSYPKAYYRRASAQFALNKFKAARKDLRQVCKLRPKDRDARAKLKDCEKAVREEAFSKAIVSDNTASLSETFDPNVITIESDYDGPHPHPDGMLSDMEAEESLFQPGNLPIEFVMVRQGQSFPSFSLLSCWIGLDWIELSCVSCNPIAQSLSHTSQTSLTHTLTQSISYSLICLGCRGTFPEPKAYPSSVYGTDSCIVQTVL